jgi:hypothetical protein
MPAVNGVGKPCAGEPHARIDGRELETGHGSGHAAEKNDPRETGRSPRLRAYRRFSSPRQLPTLHRMSSGSYFPPPVKAVEIPTPHGGGTRTLGVPTISDRVAQTVVARRLEAKVEPIFHPDSYGYRPYRSALDAVAACRERCWKTDWVIDLDIQKFFDAWSHCGSR